MKIRRILEGDRYTSPAAGGLGYVAAYAEEDGYEIDYAGTSMWLTDVALEEAMRQRLRELAIHGGGEEMGLPQLDAEPFQLIVEAKAAASARDGISQFVIPGCDADTAAVWQETIDALTPAPAGRAIGVPLNHEVVEVPSSEQIQAVLDRVDEIEAEKTAPTRCPTCDSPSPRGTPRCSSRARFSHTPMRGIGRLALSSRRRPPGSSRARSQPTGSVSTAGGPVACAGPSTIARGVYHATGSSRMARPASSRRRDASSASTAASTHEVLHEPRTSVEARGASAGDDACSRPMGKAVLLRALRKAGCACARGYGLVRGLQQAARKGATVKDRCPSCDTEAVKVIESVDDRLTLRFSNYKALVPARTKFAVHIETTRCSVCGDHLCTQKNPDWPKEHPYPPECDLWFGHPGIHRHRHLVPSSEDFVWGEGEATWEHGRLIETTKFTAYGPDSSQEVPCFYDGQGDYWDVDDLIPDGSYGLLGEWTITVTFQPKEADMTTKTTRAFYVRFQVLIAKRPIAAVTIDRFMKDFIGFLEPLGLGPTGDMSPSGQGVFLIIGVNSRSEQVIVDVKEGDPALVDEWLTKRGVPHEVDKINDIEIGPGTTTQKETP